MQQYKDIINNVLNHWIHKENRTETPTLSITWAMFEHYMQNWYPLLTLKKTPFRLVASELERMIKGITDKKRLQDRNNHIRDERCTPTKVPYAHDKKTKKAMMKERDLWPVYGFQRRYWGALYFWHKKNYNYLWVDQLSNAIYTIKNNPNSRRIIVNSWNSWDLYKMWLPPCHYCYQFIVSWDKLDLIRIQRSVDVWLWLPFNIASYALLLHLVAKETGYKEWKLVWQLGDVHIYENHEEGMREVLRRDEYPLPTIQTHNRTNIRERKYTDTEVIWYKSHSAIKLPIAV